MRARHQAYVTQVTRPRAKTNAHTSIGAGAHNVAGPGVLRDVGLRKVAGENVRRVLGQGEKTGKSLT